MPISPWSAFLFGCEVRGENASSWLGFSSRSKIDSCIHWRKGERSWGACRVYPQPPSLLPLSVPLLLWEINHSSLAARERCFLFYRPNSSFSSDSAKLFAFFGQVCHPFSHLSPPVRFTARQGRAWPGNLWWLNVYPWWARRSMQSIKSSWRDWILSFSSPEG